MSNAAQWRIMGILFFGAAIYQVSFGGPELRIVCAFLAWLVCWGIADILTAIREGR